MTADWYIGGAVLVALLLYVVGTGAANWHTHRRRRKIYHEWQERAAARKKDAKS